MKQSDRQADRPEDNGQTQAKIVVKFGGSNLRKPEDMGRLVSVLRSYNRPVVVVVSAFYGITNRLIALLDQALSSDTDAANNIGEIREYKRGVIDGHISSPEIKKEISATISQRLEELSRLLLGVHYLSEIPERIYDRVLSYGERLSSALVAAILKDSGFDAGEALPENIGLITDGEARNATVDFEASVPALEKALKRDAVYVVPGFYGVSRQGEVTLLGRGGSDYSAAAIARCISAESLDIWKDVEGFMSGDPGLVDSPRPLEVLSYREAAELSYFGARILHPRTVEPLREQGIPLRILNIHRHVRGIAPVSRIEASHSPLTDGSGRAVTHRVKSVTHTEDFGILRLSGSGVGSKAGILGRASAELAASGINIKSVITTQTSINLFLSRGDLDAARECISALSLATVARLETLDEYAIVALVGEGLEECEEIAETLILALSRYGLHAKMLSIGASAAATYFVVRREQVESALRAVHSAFFPA